MIAHDTKSGCQMLNESKGERNALILSDGQGFAKLSCCRTIKIEADHPDSCLVQHFPLMTLAHGLRRSWLV